MEDDLSKYLRLLGRIFLMFIAFIGSVVLLMLLLRFSFGLLDGISWFSYMYAVFINLVPATLFITVYIIYFKRTAFHPSKTIKVISRTLFVIAILAWVASLVWDIIGFFKNPNNVDIRTQYGYNVAFLAANVGLIFFTGVMQALSAGKEKDWMEKSRDRVSK